MDHRWTHPTRGPRRREACWAYLLTFALAVLALACTPSRQAGSRAAAERGPARPTTPPAAAPPTVAPTAPPAAGAQPAETAPGTPEAPTPARVVFLDPGHGGPDVGTGGAALDGTWVVEKDVTLAIALRTAERLRAAGISVVLSRTGDELPSVTPEDLLPDGTGLAPEGVLRDLQRRIDRANASGASLLLSIHVNGFTEPTVGGIETYYDSSRPFAGANRRLAELIQHHVVATLRSAGYVTEDRGVFDETEMQIQGLGVLPDYQHLVMLGPAVPGQLRPSEMPGALSELLFVSNPAEASAMQQPEVQDHIAAAYAQAIAQFLAAPEP